MLYILDQRRQRALFVDSMVKSSSSRVLQTASQDANNTNNCIASKVGNIGRRQYKGVRMRSWGSWVSEIRAPNQKTRIWLGSYSTAEAAARAYDAALHCLKGKSSNLNFPSSPPLIHVPDTIMSPKSIQRVAAAAAAAAANATPTLSPPPLPSSSVPSPGMASGDTLASIQMDEEAYFYEDYPLNSFDFEALYQSPKCMDYMLQPASFYAPAQVEEWVEEGDISLWSFC